MNAAKHRRDGSIAATPTVSQSNDADRSSLVQSSPLSHFQRSKHPQQRPTKSVKLRLPSNDPRAIALSSHPRPAYRKSSTSSVAASAFNAASENRIEGQEEDIDPDEIIMCVDMRDRGTVGCCYYESSTGSLHLVEDIKYGGLEVVDTCENLLQFASPRTDEEIVKLHIQPTVVILSMRVEESVEQYFDPDRMSRSSIDGGGKDPTDLIRCSDLASVRSYR